MSTKKRVLNAGVIAMVLVIVGTAVIVFAGRSSRPSASQRCEQLWTQAGSDAHAFAARSPAPYSSSELEKTRKDLFTIAAYNQHVVCTVG